LRGLISKNWVEVSDGLLRSTPDGEDEHADLAPRLDDVRSRVAKTLPQRRLPHARASTRAAHGGYLTPLVRRNTLPLTDRQ
jgi:hypothetical protein